MTYKESYENCKNEQELQEQVTGDVYVATFLFNSPKRVEVIRRAAQEVADQRGWFIKLEENSNG